MLSAIPPPPPLIFKGRDSLVQEGTDNLLSDSPHPIVIMGFGDMGKTSLALKLLDDVAVKNKYGACRYFIPCDEVCSIEPTIGILIQTVMRLMGLQTTSDPIKQLYAISKPMILLFDSFETIWDKSNNQSVQRVLEQLNTITHITLMITMRGNIPPIDNIDWLLLPHNGLSSLAESSSLEVFTAISGYSDSIKTVVKLVEKLEGWPLALMLMAYQAKILHPEVLLESWDKEKTSLLEKPGAQSHHLTSVNISIKLTLQSPLFSKPNIFKALSMICYLPDGIPSWKKILSKMLPDLSERIGIISNLLQSKIIYEDSKGGLKILQPIQEYLKVYFQKPDIYIKQQFCIFYLNESRQFEFSISQKNAKFGLSHLNNFEWIFNEILINSKNQNMQYLYALAVLLLGKRLHMFSQQQAALEKVNEAMQIFETIDNSLGVAQCLQSMGGILKMINQYTESKIKLEKAIQIFETIGKSLGVAQCLQSLGNILQMIDQYSEAIIKLEKAMQMFETIGDSLGIAQCLQSLGDILQMTLTYQYSEAKIKLEKAMQMFETIGDSLGVAQCLQSLGSILRITNQYSEAIIKLEKAMQMFETIGDSLGIAQCLQSLGNILGMMNQYSEATIKLDKAMQMFETIEDTLGAAQCLKNLGNILGITNQYSESKIKLEKAMQMFETIGNSDGVAQCLQSLGNILRITNQYSEATIKLETAMQMFETIGNSLGVAQCLQSLGNILRTTNQYSEAIIKLEKAMQMFETIGNSLGVAQCLDSIKSCQAYL
ncbi:uncharacterized protein EV420DRAFT_1322376 [Desarmillaria tabescens]|uniref:TPR-like protein n=1 Tax=Armillaria tabescens TaxID=1929756 RepID=A0AA39IV98_ARMTA|nr:uncharacterized protein EV420DRAFT_1322376 [Desarmillaria tabescens]KAK0430212.1 hypothetical protein EV420DRAFT_1322376 [Desarmillaria tabescens]